MRRPLLYRKPEIKAWRVASLQHTIHTIILLIPRYGGDGSIANTFAVSFIVTFFIILRLNCSSTWVRWESRRYLGKAVDYPHGTGTFTCIEPDLNLVPLGIGESEKAVSGHTLDHVAAKAAFLWYILVYEGFFSEGLA